MSAGTLGFEQEESLQKSQSKRAGYTSISSGTIAQLVAAIAAEAFNVPRRNVRAGVHDEQGQVSVSLAVPLAMSLMGDGGTVFERAASARAVVASRIHALAGSTVGRVDVRFTGIHEGQHVNARRVQ
ncbi:hypothetical protein ART_3229 [Arthrobacter sp. PAMC 25486]|uniref:hypothetical protein n=1 Tax=Arthrobacter sp. PAMC 25486 TaxID=1494608 RepID=UPI000535A665|nr:hypothetical protein [Arthrobacter sp. PAMC 25486]AIY02828.1 hypothetical protein ART_3229 [Arthrobacter sp. PAMC 25486]